MSNIEEKLDHLKKTLHPEKQMDIISQCEIVAEALGYGSKYEDATDVLATYLEISYSKVYQMNYIHNNMLPEVKEWFRGSEFQCHTTYEVSVLPFDLQLEWLEGMGVLEE